MRRFYVFLNLLFWQLIFFSDNFSKLTPEKYASFLSRVTFTWFDSISWTGWKRLLTENDMWTLTKENRGAGIVPLWDKFWKRAEDKAQKSHPKVSFAFFC